MNIRQIKSHFITYFMLPLVVFLGVMGICLQLWQNQKAIEARHIRALSAAVADSAKGLIQQDMKLQINSNAWPKSDILLHTHTALPNNLLLLGFILAILAAAATYYAQKNRHHLSLINATLESTTDGILSIKLDGEIVKYNRTLIEMWGVENAAKYFTNERQALDFIADQLIDQPMFYQMVQESKDMPERFCKEELQLKDGRFIECYSRPQRLAGKIIGRVWSIRNITQRKQMEDQLFHQATHDTLTGLPNRVLLVDRLQQAMLQAKRTATMVAVLFFDLDRFKFINNSLGHEMGDKLLQDVAVRLQNTIRESDTAARLGGDEFVVIVTSLISEEDVIPIVQKCLRVMREVFRIDGRDLHVTASFGISFYPKDGHEVMSLLKNADTAMYRAKQSGRNNFQFYTRDMNARAVERLELENDLRRALIRNEFVLNYQPVIDLQTNQVCSVETLLRWVHPKWGSIQPADFIPLLEEIGMITEVGNWVLHTACAQGKAWHDMGFTTLHVAVNLSSREIKQNDLVKKIDRILEETQFKPDCLELELTEGSIMENSDAIISTMSALKKRGILLLIDDFGIGYSSLSYLKEFPIDKLKIDKSFIHNISDDSEDVAIVLTIIAMGRSLKLKVLAEGVETENQYIFLKMNLCDQAQGYYISKPMNAEQCTHFMRDDPRYKYRLNQKTS